MINDKFLTTSAVFDTDKISIGDLVIIKQKNYVWGSGVVLEVTPIEISLGLYCGPNDNNHTDRLIYEMVSLSFTIDQFQNGQYDLIIIKPQYYNEERN